MFLGAQAAPTDVVVPFWSRISVNVDGLVALQKLLFQKFALVAVPAVCPSINSAVLGVFELMPFAVTNLELPEFNVKLTVSIGFIVSTAEKVRMPTEPLEAPVPRENV
jgi:hypothetical protein